MTHRIIKQLPHAFDKLEAMIEGGGAVAAGQDTDRFDEPQAGVGGGAVAFADRSQPGPQLIEDLSWGWLFEALFRRSTDGLGHLVAGLEGGGDGVEQQLIGL